MHAIAKDHDERPWSAVITQLPGGENNLKVNQLELQQAYQLGHLVTMHNIQSPSHAV